jgi:release factor glutamine methyltransferase
MAGTITWRELWAETAAAVGDPDSARRLRIGNERQVARWLCETASGEDGTDFLLILDEPATERTVHALDAMVARVRAGEPLQYVLGRWGFRRLDLMVDRRVLIPRPETEQVVDAALRIARQLGVSSSGRLLIADLGTGSGAIGLSLADELPVGAAEIWLTDVSPDALDVARANAAGVGRNASCIRTAVGSWCDALPPDRRGEFDLLVANPPYVAETGDGLEPVVRDWEPHTALFAGPDGLDHIRVIAEQSVSWLRDGGWLVLEISGAHGSQVEEILSALGYVDVTIAPDLAGIPRIAQAKRAAS